MEGERRGERHTTTSGQRWRTRERRCLGAQLREHRGDWGVRVVLGPQADAGRRRRRRGDPAPLLLVRRIGRVVVLATKHRRGGFCLLEAPGSDGGRRRRRGSGSGSAASSEGRRHCGCGRCWWWVWGMEKGRLCVWWLERREGERSTRGFLCSRMELTRALRASIEENDNSI